MKELCCYVCNKKAPPGTPGWEHNPEFPGGARDLCPKHRQQRPAAMATLGDLVAYSQSRQAR